MHALQEAPRAAWTELATVLGLEARTVARRYDQLRADGLLLVTQTVGPRLLAQTRWAVLRVVTRPGTAERVAQELARWPQATSIRVVDGAFQVYALIAAQASRADVEDIRTLWEQAQARIVEIPEIEQADVLHILDAFDVGRAGRLDVLSKAQVQQLHDLRGQPAASPGREPAELTDEDLELFTLLARDGRREVADCAVALGRNRSWVSRRIARLQADGLLDFIALTPDVASSRPVTALVWASVPAAELSALAHRVGSLGWIGMMAVTTGPSNVFAVTHLPTSRALTDALVELVEVCPSLVVKETQLSVRAVKIHTRITDERERFTEQAAQPYALELL